MTLFSDCGSNDISCAYYFNQNRKFTTRIEVYSWFFTILKTGFNQIFLSTPYSALKGYIVVIKYLYLNQTICTYYSGGTYNCTLEEYRKLRLGIDQSGKYQSQDYQIYGNKLLTFNEMSKWNSYFKCLIEDTFYYTLTPLSYTYDRWGTYNISSYIEPKITKYNTIRVFTSN